MNEVLQMVPKFYFACDYLFYTITFMYIHYAYAYSSFKIRK